MLAEHFDDCPAYVRSLHYLLDFYADRARRPGLTGTPGPLISAYKVRPPVLRMVLQELVPLAQENPAQGLALCDALWAESFLEMRQLGAQLLGQIPPEPPEPIVERVQRWITPQLEFFLLECVLQDSLERVRREHPEMMVKLVQGWLESGQKFQQQIGLRALLPLIEDQRFENLPAFFRLAQPFCRVAPPGLRPDVLDVIAALARRSPQETAYFLRQTLTSPEAPDAPWLVRQSLEAFPADIQNGLRQAARK